MNEINFITESIKKRLFKCVSTDQYSRGEVVFMTFFGRIFTIHSMKNTSFRVYDPKFSPYLYDKRKGKTSYSEDLSLLNMSNLAPNDFYNKLEELNIPREQLDSTSNEASIYTKIYPSVNAVSIAILEAINSDSWLQGEIEDEKIRYDILNKISTNPVTTKDNELSECIKTIFSNLATGTGIFSGFRSGKSALNQIDRANILCFMNSPGPETWLSIHNLKCLNQKTIGALWFEHDSTINADAKHYYPAVETMLLCFDKEREVMKSQAMSLVNQSNNNIERMRV